MNDSAFMAVNTFLLANPPDISDEFHQRVETGTRLYDRFEAGREREQADIFEALSPAYYPRAMELTGLVCASPELSL